MNVDEYDLLLEVFNTLLKSKVEGVAEIDFSVLLDTLN